ncbi:MAG: acyl-CoA dehydrogenase family protein [Planctomycetaceae bacterium]
MPAALCDDWRNWSAAFGPGFESLCEDLRARSGELERDGAWPEPQFERLAEAGVLGWVIPREYGGSDLSATELTAGYERLARACLVTTFVLTQRNGACQRIAGSENEALKAELLPRLCRGENFATVGISHLTTSRQHLSRPAVEARETDGGFVLTGSVPWVTGSGFADFVVTGGTCGDGRQILVALPMHLNGVTKHAPPRLLALNASQTASVTLDQVELDAHHLIAGPIERVMSHGSGGGAGSLTTSALAIGTAAAAIEQLGEEVERRPDLAESHDRLVADWNDLDRGMLAALTGDARDGEPPPSNEAIRQRANSLALRASQAFLAASKGAGFVAGHPAERLVREAMFFLVWSCPQPVLQATLRELACALE